MDAETINATRKERAGRGHIKGLPRNWTIDSARGFYDAHEGSVKDMAATIDGWGTVKEPYALAARIKDVVTGTTDWRKGPQMTNEEVKEYKEGLEDIFDKDNPCPREAAPNPEPEKENPMPNYHSARVESPSKFKKDSFRSYKTKSLDKQGIYFIIGKKPYGRTMKRQAVRFRADMWTPGQAKTWLRQNKIKFKRFETADTAAPNPDIFGGRKSKKAYTQADVDEAIEIYKAFTGREPKKVKMVVMDGKSVFVDLGRADSITYEAEKHGQPTLRYNHRIEDPKARVLWDVRNKMLAIRGKDLEVTEAGIEG